MHVPALSEAEHDALLEDLRAWVGQLVVRFALDPRTIPPCWERHNAMVEALSAMRDFERGTFTVDALPTAGLGWLHAVVDVTGYLREQTATAGCSMTSHRPPPPTHLDT